MYAQRAGSGWTDDLTIDQKELENAKYRSEVNIKRFKAAEVHIVKEGDDYRFPLIEYDMKQPGNTPPYIRPKTNRPLARAIIPRAERELAQTVRDEDATGLAGARAEDDLPNPDAESQGVHGFWTMTKECVIRHHHRPRMSMNIPPSDSFPLPLKYIDVTRAAETDMEELALRRISDIWRDQGERVLDAPSCVLDSNQGGFGQEEV